MGRVVGLTKVQRLKQAADRHAGALFIGGMVAVGVYNAFKWREDRPLARRLAEARGDPHPALSHTPRVSILVAAWNEAATIAHHLESVRALRYPDLEYVLCAGGPDGTYDLAQRHLIRGMALLQQQPGEGKQAALGRCLAEATGEVCFLTDADCALDNASFERTLSPVIHGEADAATGGSRPQHDEFAHRLARYRWSAEIYAMTHAPGRTSGLLGRNAAVRRDLLERCGSLRAAVRSGTDYHLAKSLLRVGARIVSVPESEVTTRYGADLGAYARQQRRWLRNVVLHGIAFGADAEVAASLQTSLIGLTMLVAPFGAIRGGPLVRSLWLVALAQSVVAKIRYLAFGAIVRGERIGLIESRAALGVVPLSLFEFAVWSLPLLDYLVPSRGSRW